MKKTYNFLYSQSYLLTLGIKMKYLDELEVLLVPREENKPMFRKGYMQQTQGIMDICEKIGFLHLALEYMVEIEEKGAGQRLAKYHFYNFIYHCKACLDSIAVLLNHQLNLGFSGGKIDFRNMSFVQKLQQIGVFTKDFWKKFGQWITRIIDYRDAIIHRVSVPVLFVGNGPPSHISLPHSYYVPKKPYSIVKLVAPSWFSLPKEKRTKFFLKIRDFCEQSIENIVKIAEMAFAEVYEKVKEQ